MQVTQQKQVIHGNGSGYDKPMFKCTQCGSTEFQLVLQQGQTVPVSMTVAPNRDVVLTVGGRQYVADLPFMNRYAVCRQCESIRKWAYFYPDRSHKA
jgi:hypothetical protein